MYFLIPLGTLFSSICRVFVHISSLSLPLTFLSFFCLLSCSTFPLFLYNFLSLLPSFFLSFALYPRQPLPFTHNPLLSISHPLLAQLICCLFIFFSFLFAVNRHAHQLLLHALFFTSLLALPQPHRVTTRRSFFNCLYFLYLVPFTYSTFLSHFSSSSFFFFSSLQTTLDICYYS